MWNKITNRNSQEEKKCQKKFSKDIINIRKTIIEILQEKNHKNFLKVSKKLVTQIPDFIMITERFYESILMMRKLLCMDFLDLYVQPKKVKTHESLEFSTKQKIRFYEFNSMDLTMYTVSTKIPEKIVSKIIKIFLTSKF